MEGQNVSKAERVREAEDQHRRGLIQYKAAVSYAGVRANKVARIVRIECGRGRESDCSLKCTQSGLKKWNHGTYE